MEIEHGKCYFFAKNNRLKNRSRFNFIKQKITAVQPILLYRDYETKTKICSNIFRHDIEHKEIQTTHVGYC